MAGKKVAKVKDFLRERGFSKPLYACSGNGYHLLYRVNFERSAENVKLMERALKALSMLFTDDKIKVDAANFNPAQLCKLYGTRAQKGADAPEAPHRMSKIIDSDVGERLMIESCLNVWLQSFPIRCRVNQIIAGLNSF